MDLEAKIKEEPVWLEGAASTSLPSADIKEEISIEQQKVDQLVPFIKEESVEGNGAELTSHIGERVLRSSSRKSDSKRHNTEWKAALDQKNYLRGQILAQPRSLKLVHSRKRPYKGQECKLTFRRQHLVRIQPRPHSGGKLHKCRECQRMCSVVRYSDRDASLTFKRGGLQEKSAPHRQVKLKVTTADLSSEENLVLMRMRWRQ
ncbi:zinc finger protein 14 homolog [Anabrus simplex]|uniref:zinc finger protein 14 homolog n=1 Tax=Anabrus simplex TaxID=316456 RepID=UPI0035A3399A